MKRLAYILVLTALAFACTKPAAETENVNPAPEERDYTQGFAQLDSSEGAAEEPGLLASGIILPRAFAPCLHSDALSIPLRGATDGLGLRFMDGDTPHEATVLGVSDAAIRFMLPEDLVSGWYRILLTGNGKYQELGRRYVMCDTPADTPGVNVSGEVLIGTAPGARVVVTDGFEFTVSDLEGKYALKSAKANGYVFAQARGNTVAHVDRAIPSFFKYFTSSDTTVVEHCDFAFDAVDNTNHRFLFVTDLHLGRANYNEEGLCTERFLPDLNSTIQGSTVPCYVFTGGDQTTESRWVSSHFDLNDWRDYVADWKCPVYHCIGNHDHDPQYVASDWNSESTYKRIIGPNWYSLDIGKVHYVVLDDIVYDNSPATQDRGYYVRVPQYQLDYLEKDLLKVDTETPVVVVMHSPLYLCNGLGSSTPRYDSYEDIDDLLDVFDGFREVHLLSGHTHVNHNVEVRPGIFEHNMAASSASAWLTEYNTGMHLHVCRDGTTGGYQIWDAAGSSLSWRHKAMERSLEEGQFHMVDFNQVPEDLRRDAQENDMLINIYNWDDHWQLKVTEAGRELPVTQVYRDDPLYTLIFPTKISSQTVFARTDHLFTVRASSATSTLKVSVTDRFGNNYSKTVTRPYPFTLDNYE